MKILSTIFLLIAFIALGGSFFLFTKINGKLAELEAEKSSYQDKYEEAKQESNEMANSLNIASRRADTLIAEKRSVEANLSRVTDSIQRTRDNLAAAQREIQTLKNDKADLNKLVKNLEDSIKNNAADGAQVVFTQLQELRNEIDQKDVRIQEYQDELAELKASLEIAKGSVNFETLKEGEKQKTELLAYDLNEGIVAVALGESNKLVAGTKLNLTNLGFPVAQVLIKNVKSDFSVGTILPGVNRLSRMSVGDEIEFSIIVDNNEES